MIDKEHASYPDQNSLTDEELMEKTRQRDDIAFETLVLRYEDKMFHLAKNMIGSADETRDALQEVFISIWENPWAYKPKHPFSTWLHRVVVNRCLNVLRTKRIRRFLSLSSDEEYTPDPPIPKRDQPDQQLLKGEIQQEFQRHFANLPGKQKAALHLKYLEGLSMINTAKNLGVTTKAAESLIYRAKQTIKDKMGSKFTETLND